MKITTSPSRAEITQICDHLIKLFGEEIFGEFPPEMHHAFGACGAILEVFSNDGSSFEVDLPAPLDDVVDSALDHCLFAQREDRSLSSEC